MGRKTPISFNLRKYVEKQWNARSDCLAKQEKRRAATQTTLSLI